MGRSVLAAALWLLGALWTATRFARRFLMAALVVVLLITNVLAFTSTAFVGAVSAAASAVGVATVQAKAAAARSTVVRRAATRVARVAVRGAASAPLRAVPLIGATLEDLAALDAEAAPLPETCRITNAALAD
jgi:hypothetical protein